MNQSISDIWKGVCIVSVVVMKFGGTSVADSTCVKNVAEKVAKAYKKHGKVVVVVSAQGDTTDNLIKKAGEINPSPSKREMDVLLSAGEQMSMALLAMAIENLMLPVVSLTGRQAGIKTNLNYGDAKIVKVNTERILAELSNKKIVIIAGFQGVNRNDDITTLGRGGSDTSAVAVAVALNAELCEIYTDVDGVYTADPRIVPDAKKLKDISYDEMLELSSLGANVLHNRSVEMGLRYNNKIEVKSSFSDEPGTVIKEVNKVEKMLVRGVAMDRNISKFTIIEVENTVGQDFRIFSLLAKKNISVDIITQSTDRNNKNDIVFTVHIKDAEKTLEIIKENIDYICAKDVICDNNVAKVSIVGAGMASNPGVASKMFEALYDEDINIQLVSTSEIKVSVLVDQEVSEKAVRAIHDKFDFGD